MAREVEFDTDCLAVPADTPFTIELDSVDIAPHNIAIQEPDGELFFDGDTVQGETIIYEVDPIPPGTYRFYCEVHPAQMQGVFIAE